MERGGSVLPAQDLNRIRGGLLEKRDNIARWLQGTPGEKRRVRTGPANEQAVRRHVHALDRTLAETENSTFGLCEVCHEPVEPARLEMDYTTTVCIIHYSPEQIEQLEAELQLAQVVQRALLPHEAPDIPGMQVAAFSRPAQIVGGDYFDFVRFRSGAYGLAIADVAGHGMAASLLMASVQTALRALAPTSDSPADVVHGVHRLFCHNVRFTTFVSLFLAAFDPATRTLTYCNAGHNPPLRLRAGADGPDRLEPTGAAVGLVEEAVYDSARLTLAPGDMLVLYTDGVTEAFNPRGEMFGEAGLAAAMQQAAGRPAGAAAHALREAVTDFAAGQPFADDVTIVTCAIDGRREAD
jgi:serine phosphatase RsbU (regulator of sigma subunit)